MTGKVDPRASDDRKEKDTKVAHSRYEVHQRPSLSPSHSFFFFLEATFVIER